jgi:hypothetical protein
LASGTSMLKAAPNDRRFTSPTPFLFRKAGRRIR